MNPLIIIAASPLVLKVAFTLSFIAGIALATTFFMIAIQGDNDGQSK